MNGNYILCAAKGNYQNHAPPPGNGPGGQRLEISWIAQSDAIITRAGKKSPNQVPFPDQKF